jgi:hypothetical protein
MVLFVYCAWGRPYYVQACVSAQSVKKYCPDSRVVVYSDHVSACDAVDEHRRLHVDLELPDDRKNAKVRKLLGIQDAAKNWTGPVIFLDADTFVGGNVEAVLAALPVMSIGAALDTWRQVSYSSHRPTPNSGVILAHEAEVLAVLASEWVDAYCRDNGVPDQTTFARLLYEGKNGVKFRVLPPELNVRAGEPVHLSGPALVLHKHFNKLSNPDPMRLLNFLNTTRDNRVFIPDALTMHAIGQPPNFGLRTLQLSVTPTEDERKAYAALWSFENSTQEVTD